MKCYVVILYVVTQLIIANSKTLPDYFPELCKKSEPDYTACALKGLHKLAPYLFKGIPKYNIPKLDPLEVPYMVVNRTLNDFLSMQAIIKNAKVLGLSTAQINDFKTDLRSQSGEIKYTIPLSYVTMEYNVLGQLLTIPLKSEGFFKGNFSDTYVHMKGSLKTVIKDGVEYFALDKFKVKSRVGNGYVKLISKNPQDQFGADLIANFYNDNPRRTMDAINPLYVETLTDFFKIIIEQGLAKVPAAELLPE